MKVNAKKRFLAWTLAFLMVITYMPSTAFATGDGSDAPNAETTTIESQEIESVVEDVTSETEIIDVEPESTSNNVQTVNSDSEETYDEIPVLGGDVIVTNVKGTGTISNGVITITSPGSSSPTANIIKVYNQTLTAATLSFEYEAENYSDFSEGTANGTYTAILAAKEAATLSITGKVANVNNVAVLKLSNFNLEPVQETSKITFYYDESLGNVSASGEKVKSNDKKDVDFETGTELIASPNSGVEFLGWINKETNRILSKEATYLYKPEKDASVEAVFINKDSQGYYMAGDKYLFSDLTEAAQKAVKLSNKTVVLMNSAVLTGKHEIPAGVTLLIPFDEDNTVYKINTANRIGLDGEVAGGKDPEGDLGSHVTPTIYRQLTMTEGSSLVVNGDLSLSAKHHAAVTGSNGGSPTGKVSQIVMSENSNITVNDGAALYAYGYITGNGNVDIKSGAHVFEYFQFEDWRGGSASLGIANDFEHGVFPISQYYVQNIEVPLKLEAGASEWVYTSVNIGGTSVIGAPVEFMGSEDAMFNLETGYVVKSYDGSTDRLNIDAVGTMSLSPITAKIGSNSVPTKDHELPINSNITVRIKDTTKAKITQDLALLPGSEIIIEEGAQCALDKGVSVYAYDSAQWDGYCGDRNKKFVPINYAPGKSYTRTEADLVDAKVQIDGEMDASKGNVYSTVTLDDDGKVLKGGANIFSTKNGKFVTTSGEQLVTNQFVQNGTEGTFVDISIFPALLTNEDGTQIQTWDYTTAGTYRYTNGIWVCNHAGKTETVEIPATCEATGVKIVTCAHDKKYHNYSHKEEIPATGHANTVKTNAVDATCEDNGNVAYWTCNDCKKLFLDKACTEETTAKDVVIEALKHVTKQHEAKEATCTEAGWDAYETCTREGCTYTTYKENPALDHKITHVDAVAKTCEKDGNKEYWYCDRCEVYFADEDLATKYDAEPVIKAGHEMEYFDETPATCTEDGRASGGKCRDCGHTTDAAVIPALGHDTTYHDLVEATCTKSGNAEYWHCSRCNLYFEDKALEVGKDKKPVIDALNHDTTHYEAVKADCEKSGNDEYWQCNRCKLYFADEENETVIEAAPVIDALGHKLIKVDAVAATCTKAGNEEYWQCNNCNRMFEDEYYDGEYTEIPVIAPLNHTEEIIEAVAPTCTEAGLTAGVKCSVCGEILTKPEPVDSLGGHKWDTGTITKLPTEKTDGAMLYKCVNKGCTETKTEKIKPSKITNYNDFIEAIDVLEDWAFEYAMSHNVEDSAELVIKYVRTGVDRYNSGSWEIMAGYENTDFAKYVAEKEAKVNTSAESDADKVNVTGLKNISNFTLPNGDYTDIGHMFGTIDISYTNKPSVDHEDVAGLFGDTTDLLSTADRYNVRGTTKEMVAEITQKYFLQDNVDWDDKFGKTDMIGDLDGYYVNRKLVSSDYEKGMLTDIMREYFTESLTEAQRAKYYLDNRLKCGASKAAVRDAVYSAYVGNSVIATLEGTREFNASGDDLEELRKAVCYTVADYICKLAGDYTADIDNPYFTVNSEQFETLAPGITQEVKTGKLADGRPMKYYIATADITRDDVSVYANYPSRPIKKDENGDYVWDRMRVLDQAKNAQETYGNPESQLYIENFNVVASTNADGYDMTGSSRGEPGGLLVMDGEEIAPIKSNGFFGILKNGKAVIGTSAEYNNIYREQVAEAVGGFGAMLIKDGKIVASGTTNYAPRTAVGITGSGKVVMMVLDGRQNSEDSAGPGGDMVHIAHIMLEAGCVDAVNLDGGGSSTFVSKQPGDEELTLLNNPSDGYQRSVASSLIAVSTAKSSTTFDHAVIKAPTNFMTVGSEMQLTADGVTSTGNAIDIPDEVEWVIAEEDVNDAEITEDGLLKALKLGTINVNMMLDGVEVGSKQIKVVVPDGIKFTKSNIDVVYGAKVTLPIKGYYGGKAVTVNAEDFEFAISNENAGKMEGLDFVAGSESTGLKTVDVTALVKDNDGVSAKIKVSLYKQGENTFDFDQKTGGDRQFAWQRTVSNSTTNDNTTYYADKIGKEMVTEYTFAIDMREIPFPEKLRELEEILPGSDAADACAWTYMCRLAQRLSDISEVTATVKIDDDFKLVDYDKIEVKNEYFQMPKDGSGIVYNEEENTVTLKLNWKRQSSPIDVEMADPLCMVKGIKLVPKDDANWGNNATLNAINEGKVSYEVYMRASSLYSFANDKNNQEKYDLKPFSRTYIDNDGIEQTEAGAGFGATYKTFKDSYSIVDAAKSGWFVEDGGWKYYVDGETLKGIHQIKERVDGKDKMLYYDFGDEGIIKGNTKKTYTGFIEEGLLNKTYSYSQYGELVAGWVLVGKDWHYFDPETKQAYKAGKHKITVTAETQSSALGDQTEIITETVEFDLDETGKVLNGGTWFVNSEGKTFFYYGPGFLCRQWGEKDGKRVYFAMGGYLLTGIVRIREDSERPGMYYMFDEETCELIKMCEGFVEYNGYTYYYPTEEERMSGMFPEDSQDVTSVGTLYRGRVRGFQKINGKYYLFTDTYGAMRTGTRTVEHGIEGACTKLTFDKTNGYAVDKKGNARTDLSHVYSSAVHFVAPTSSASAKYYKECTECGNKKYTTKSVWESYVKSKTKRTTVKASALGSRKTETITVKWKPSTSAVSYYKVQRATKKNGTYKTVASKVKTTSYVDKTAKIGQTYYYKVTGYSYVGSVKYQTKVSSKVSAKIKTVTKSYVQGTKITASTVYKAKAVQVKWEAPRIKATRYEIYRATSSKGTYKKIATLKYGNLSYTDKNVKVGKKYYYKVRAYKTVKGKKVYTKYSSKVSRTVAK